MRPVAPGQGFRVMPTGPDKVRQLSVEGSHPRCDKIHGSTGFVTVHWDSQEYVLGEDLPMRLPAPLSIGRSRGRREGSGGEEVEDQMTTPADRDQEIRNLAYFLWEKAGRPTGQEHDFWAEAARRVEGAEPCETPLRENRFVAR